ncbi:isopenicillin N synthase family oxygenase [Luminiphilus sp.]|nr:isopenicillin N synthase family oxygenase [Luminiphilus sp.]MDA9579942.1 isopenicillin N synthase family oxygenase [Luminiphilus sp.]MDB2616326.1 isopenicillin N synthase family oxygenase [Luminiphilus sp.]MDB3923068.1 isopenicillin N synthase family oxygenase [Luminiphilus sp.]
MLLNEGLPIAVISERQRLVFPIEEDLGRAWALGVFYLKIPDPVHLESAREFGCGLLDPDSPYRKIPQYGDLEGFIALENNQQTKLALRRHHWEQHYPADITQFGRELDRIGVAVIREVLRQSGIPEVLWSRASGGYAAGEGTAFLNFVHYDTRNPDLGLRPHTDYGFVTILDATAVGLQIKIAGDFVDVPVLPGHLVINFGEALHFITAHSERSVGAVVHRVLSQKSSDPVRHGIVYFANPDLEGMLWQFDAKGEVKGSSSVQNLFTLLETNLTEDR